MFCPKSTLIFCIATNTITPRRLSATRFCYSSVCWCCPTETPNSFPKHGVFIHLTFPAIVHFSKTPLPWQRIRRQERAEKAKRLGPFYSYTFHGNYILSGWIDVCVCAVGVHVRRVTVVRSLDAPKLCWISAEVSIIVGRGGRWDGLIENWPGPFRWSQWMLSFRFPPADRPCHTERWRNERNSTFASCLGAASRSGLDQLLNWKEEFSI